MFCVVKLKSIKIFVAICTVCILLALRFSNMSSAQVFFGYNVRLVPVYRVETENKSVAISFDAGWGSEKTEDILQILEEYDVKATFFLVGLWIDENPQLVEKIYNSGHEIGNHSNTHKDLAKLTQASVGLEISTVNEKVEKITGVAPSVFRSPYGSYNNTVINTCSLNKLVCVQWDVDSLDWKGISAQQITTNILNKTKSGSIVLMHNDSKNIVQSLPMTLDRLKGQGYKICSVGDLIYKTNYTIDRAGVQKLKS